MSRKLFVSVVILAGVSLGAADVDRTVPDDAQRVLRLQRADEEAKAAEAIAAKRRAQIDERLKGEKLPDVPPDNNDDWQATLKKSLEKNVSFEFNETPLSETLDFLNRYAHLNLIVDPAVLEHAGPVTLKVAEMPVYNVLNWLCKLANARYEVVDHAVHIQSNGGPFIDRGARQIPDQARLRVKLPNGAEIEADGGMLNEVPELLQTVLGQINDTTKDGVLVYRLDDPARVQLAEKSKEMLTKLTPALTVVINSGLKVLVVGGDDPVQLRRAAAVLNAVMLPQRAQRGDKQGRFDKNALGFDPEQIRDEMMRRMAGKGQDPFNNPGQPDVKNQRKLKLGMGPDEIKQDTVRDKF